uniref:Uncharacterized protein n=1 Tax=Romanomermis culicivorax TaxID=13658 RepID=A0A915IVX4_ROMCU
MEIFMHQGQELKKALIESKIHHKAIQDESELKIVVNEDQKSQWPKEQDYCLTFDKTVRERSFAVENNKNEFEKQIGRKNYYGPYRRIEKSQSVEEMRIGTLRALCR